MSKIITIAAMIFSLLIGTAYAEIFYKSDQSGLWTAVGIIEDEKNAKCLSFMEYEDGSSVEVVRVPSLRESELQSESQAVPQREHAPPSQCSCQLQDPGWCTFAPAMARRPQSVGH